MVKPKVVAIIPARGGSKRIPKKNIIDFNGKPLIAWTIEAALKSDLFDKVIVSTDSEEVAEVAKRYGAELPGLRKSKADDFSPVSEATISALRQMEEEGWVFDNVVQLMAVCPLRTAGDIQDAYAHFIEGKIGFQISCFKFTWMNPWWAVTLDNEGHPTSIFNDRLSNRSQDLPDLYCPTGAIWIAKVNDLFRENTFYGTGHVFREMDWKRAIDIDSYEDLALARSLKNLDEA
jgi:CMP-N-acetylneuraminic acid synthetase